MNILETPVSVDLPAHEHLLLPVVPAAGYLPRFFHPLQGFLHVVEGAEVFLVGLIFFLLFFQSVQVCPPDVLRMQVAIQDQNYGDLKLRTCLPELSIFVFDLGCLRC